MASEKPSAWALQQARVAVTLGTCNCDSPGREPCFVHTAIATALDVARLAAINEERSRIIEAVERAIGRGVTDGGAYRADIRSAIATALDAAREQGRREREAEIVGWLRTAAAECGAYSGNSFVIAADKIERGAGRKEDK